MTQKTIILCEDSYGVDFFRELVNRLKNENVIPEGLHVDANRFYGKCNPKLKRQMKPMAFQKGFNLFIIVADADGNPVEGVKAKIECHVPDDFKKITHYIIFNYEIEEWICVSLNIKINDKPSNILKRRFGYEKYKLKDYVSKLNFKRLKNCQSFNEFIRVFKSASST